MQYGRNPHGYNPDPRTGQVHPRRKLDPVTSQRLMAERRQRSREPLAELESSAGRKIAEDYRRSKRAAS